MWIYSQSGELVNIDRFDRLAVVDWAEGGCTVEVVKEDHFFMVCQRKTEVQAREVVGNIFTAIKNGEKVLDVRETAYEQD